MVVWVAPGCAGALFSQLLPGWPGALAAGLISLLFTLLIHIFATAIRVSVHTAYNWNLQYEEGRSLKRVRLKIAFLVFSVKIHEKHALTVFTSLFTILALTACTLWRQPTMFRPWRNLEKKHCRLCINCLRYQTVSGCVEVVGEGSCCTPTPLPPYH